MPRSLAPRRTHAERSQATQQQIVAAAVAVIDVKGLQGASMFEIAKAAGVTPGALQHHFASKTALILRAAGELVHADDQHGALAVWAVERVDAPLPVRAREAVHNAWGRMYSQPRYLAMWSIFLGMRSDVELTGHLAAERAKLRQRSLDGFFAVFPELRCDAAAESFADMVFSTLRGMGLLVTFGEPQPHYDALLEHLARTIADRCLAQTAAPAAKTARRRVPTPKKA